MPYPFFYCFVYGGCWFKENLDRKKKRPLAILYPLKDSQNQRLRHMVTNQRNNLNHLDLRVSRIAKDEGIGNFLLGMAEIFCQNQTAFLVSTF